MALAVALALIYFAVGQGMGGILTGSGTDPCTGRLLVWLALAIYAIRQPNNTPGRYTHQTHRRVGYSSRLMRREGGRRDSSPKDASFR